MASHTFGGVSRRGFLGRTLAAAAALPLAPAFVPDSAASTAASDASTMRTSRYRSLTAAEAAFTEALVNTRCPADALTPDGVTSGLAAFIDASLAGEVESIVPGQRELFRTGLAAADAACAARHGVPFAQLSRDEATRFLRDVAAGDVSAGFPLASWSADVVEPLLTQACFSGAVYDAHEGRMFWKLFG